jgi:hypothetical protein
LVACHNTPNFGALPGRFSVDFCASCDFYFVLEIFESKKKKQKKKKTKIKTKQNKTEQKKNR